MVEIYYVPLSKAQEIVNNHPRWMEVRIEGAPVVDKDALKAEREQLMQRIAEIDALLEKE